MQWQVNYDYIKPKAKFLLSSNIQFPIICYNKVIEYLNEISHVLHGE